MNLKIIEIIDIMLDKQIKTKETYNQGIFKNEYILGIQTYVYLVRQIYILIQRISYKG